jgi:predicted nucleotidyltransferase
MAYSRDDAVRIASGFLREAALRHAIRRAFLFGSYAWGLPAEHSDIDLAVVLGPSSGSESAGFGESFEIFHEAQKYNSTLEVVSFTLEEFESDDAALVRRIKKEGLEVPVGREIPSPDRETLP